MSYITLSISAFDVATALDDGATFAEILDELAGAAEAKDEGSITTPKSFIGECGETLSASGATLLRAILAAYTEQNS